MFKRLLTTYKDCKQYKKDYRIKWEVNFDVDSRYYCFALLPTITWMPWPFRYMGCGVIDIWWLTFHICIGTWQLNEKEVK